MADLESNYEKKVTWPETTVVKIGHHGAYTSSCDYFLDQTKPKYSIISVGKDNSYNHPSSATLKRLRKRNSEIYRTDEKGTILLTSNGTDINFDFYDNRYYLWSENKEGSQGRDCKESCGGVKVGAVGGVW